MATTLILINIKLMVSLLLFIKQNKILKISLIKGCLMVIAWVLFATTGILIARYYRFLAPNSEICGVSLWFVLHRLIMLVSTSLSIAGFLIILSQLNWNWVSMNNKYIFSQSIFGIVAIGISVLQVKYF